MTRPQSLNARFMTDAEALDVVELLLIEITHPDLSEPIRLSSDNTERLSDDPLIYGTRSTWRGADPLTEPFLFSVASIVPPSDQEDEPATAQLVIMNIDTSIAQLLQGLVGPMTANIALVFADNPNEPDEEWLDLELSTAEGDIERITLSFSREEIELEIFPAGRMTRQYFPGLFS